MCHQPNKSLLLQELEALALSEAAKSPCKKRKVGAVVVTNSNRHYLGHNQTRSGAPCEDEQGETTGEVVHAEVVALEKYQHDPESDPAVMIVVTQPPCDSCLAAIKRAGITTIHVVETFMKFDASKPRYDLIPPSSTQALAEVLTYGAKKYKPDNWRKGDVARYTAAAMRHLEAWRGGEQNDSESGLSHLAHLMTNVAFLIELTKE